MNKKGFTLLELLVVIAIIGILVATVAGFLEKKHKQKTLNQNYTENSNSKSTQGVTILYNGKTYEGCIEK